VLDAFECADCGVEMVVPPGMCVVDHPAVVSLYHEQGIDLRERPILTLPWLAASHPVVEAEDPVRVRLDIDCEGDRLTLWLDGDADVVETERD
jgi:hypothetical protein